MILYLLTNLANGKVYVGQTIHTVDHRWKAHQSVAKTCRKKGRLYAAIRKYGAASFRVEEIAKVQDLALLSIYEQRVIEIMESTNPAFGYNMTNGGEQWIPNTEQREAISARMKGNKHAVGSKWTEEHRRNQSERLKALPPIALGIPKSMETRRRMSESGKRRMQSLVLRTLTQQMGHANKGRKHTETAKANMAQSHVGGKRSPETKQKMSEARKRWWEKQSALGEIQMFKKLLASLTLISLLAVPVYCGYRDQMDLAKDPIFIQRVKMAMIQSAVTISNEATNTVNHANRAALARTVLNGPDGWAMIFAVGVAADSINFPASITRDGSGNILTINGATAGADAGMDGRILNLWNAYAGQP